MFDSFLSSPSGLENLYLVGSSSLTFISFDPTFELWHRPGFRDLVIVDMSNCQIVHVIQNALCDWDRFANRL